MTYPDESPLSAGPLLKRIAQELLQCRSILARIEHSVHLTMEGPASQSVPLAWQKNLQDIDLLEQNLGDLATCLSAVADQPAMRSPHDLNEAQVLGPLRLEDLRHRLHGKPALPQIADPIEIF
jgi:hypothetical protein